MSDIGTPFRNSSRPNQDNFFINAYTCQRGKARRASPVRRLAKRHGSPTLSERKYSQTRQTKCGLGVAMVDGLHSIGRNARAKTGVGNSRCGRQHDSSASTKSRRGAPSSAESREDHAVFLDLVSGVCGTVFHPEFLPYTEALNSATLSPHPQQSPFACLWRFSPLRYRHLADTAVRFAEVRERPRLGVRRPLSQSSFETVRNGQEVGSLRRRQSGNGSRTPREESGSGKARASTAPDTRSFGRAGGTCAHDGFARGAHWFANRRDFGSERCEFQLRRDSSRASLLSGRDRLSQNQRQPTYASDAGGAQNSANAFGRAIRAAIGRAISFSVSQWNSIQRHQPVAQATKASRSEAGDALAQLAHAPAHSRHALAACRSYAARRPSAVGSHQNVHYARNLHASHRPSAAAGSRKSLTNGDQW